MKRKTVESSPLEVVSHHYKKMTMNPGIATHLQNEFGAKEGLSIGRASANNLAGTIELAKKIGNGVMVTLFPDTI